MFRDTFVNIIPHAKCIKKGEKKTFSLPRQLHQHSVLFPQHSKGGFPNIYYSIGTRDNTMPYTDKSKPPKKVLQSHPISFLVSDTILYKETSVLCREGEIYLGREDYK